VSKIGFALSSLVAVIPAAFMLYLFIIAMMGGNLSGMLMIMTIVGIIAGVGVIALPILGFIMGPKSPSAPKKDKGNKADEADVEEIEDFEDETFVETDDAETMEGDFGPDDFSDETLMADADEDWNDSDFENMDFDDDEFKDA